MILSSNTVPLAAPRIARGAKALSDKEIDLALVQRVQRGDKSAFDLLVLKYQHKIGHLVTRYVHDVHESQDVTQEAFIKAYRGLKNFRGDSAFYTWLYRIAINTAKNHLVTRSRKISDSGIDAADAEQFESGVALRENASIGTVRSRIFRAREAIDTNLEPLLDEKRR